MALNIWNLGCGAKTSDRPNVVNVDWSIYLRLRDSRLARWVAPHVLTGERLKRFLSIPSNVLVHNLSRGIPAPSDSVDVVYNSHVLEHLDREVARQFLLEIKRVLKPNGVLRVVVPDLEHLVRRYIQHLESAAEDQEKQAKHDQYIAAIIEQSVRREAHGTSRQTRLVRALENLFLGDARKRGETHQWMYDKVSLCQVLRTLGFKNTQVVSYEISRISDWRDYGLDINALGEEYKPGSLYVEAQK